MSVKYYRVLKDTPLWNEGAIISNEVSSRYSAVNDLWDALDLNNEYLTCHIIESPNNSQFFERVYPVGKLEKMLFGNKKQAQAAASVMYKGDEK